MARYIPQGIRNEVAKRDRGICFYCNLRASTAEINKRGVLTYFDSKGHVFHIDHRLPTSQGGKSEPDNLVLACADCNLSRRKKKAANDPEVLAILSAFKKIN